MCIHPFRSDHPSPFTFCPQHLLLPPVVTFSSTTSIHITTSPRTPHH